MSLIYWCKILLYENTLKRWQKKTSIQHIASSDPSCFLQCKYMVHTGKHKQTHTPSLPPTQTNTANVWYLFYYGRSHAEPLRQLFLCEFVCVSVCLCVCCLQCTVFSCWWWKWFGKNAVEKGGASWPLNQQGRALNESAALTRADANWRAAQCGVTNTHIYHDTMYTHIQ